MNCPLFMDRLAKENHEIDGWLGLQHSHVLMIVNRYYGQKDNHAPPLHVPFLWHVSDGWKLLRESLNSILVPPMRLFFG